MAALQRSRRAGHSGGFEIRLCDATDPASLAGVAAGAECIVNAVLGKTLAPNQVQPRWILEGLGVYAESARTSAGRLRNSQWDMFMRADVLENHVAGLDPCTPQSL